VLAVFILFTRLLEYEDGPESFLLERLAVPRAGYFIKELDYAVEMSAGILTLICSIYRTLILRALSTWERF